VFALSELNDGVCGAVGGGVLAALNRGEMLPPADTVDDVAFPLTTVVSPFVAPDGRAMEGSRQHAALPAESATADPRSAFPELVR
jgi:hypothetical protein